MQTPLRGSRHCHVPTTSRRRSGGLRKAPHDLDQGSRDAVEPLNDTVEPLIDTVEPLIDTVEPLIDTVEPLIETVETTGVLVLGRHDLRDEVVERRGVILQPGHAQLHLGITDHAVTVATLQPDAPEFPNACGYLPDRAQNKRSSTLSMPRRTS
jgi:hypothetical protein